MSDSVSVPCPWCEDGGEPFLHYCREIYFSYTVRCRSCGAQGPRIKFNMEDFHMKRIPWEDFITPIQQKAIDAWNDWMKRYRRRRPLWC